MADEMHDVKPSSWPVRRERQRAAATTDMKVIKQSLESIDKRLQCVEHLLMKPPGLQQEPLGAVENKLDLILHMLQTSFNKASSTNLSRPTDVAAIPFLAWCAMDRVCIDGNSVGNACQVNEPETGMKTPPCREPEAESSPPRASHMEPNIQTDAAEAKPDNQNVEAETDPNNETDTEETTPDNQTVGAEMEPNNETDAAVAKSDKQTEAETEPNNQIDAAEAKSDNQIAEAEAEPNNQTDAAEAKSVDQTAEAELEPNHPSLITDSITETDSVRLRRLLATFVLEDSEDERVLNEYGVHHSEEEESSCTSLGQGGNETESEQG